MRLRDSWILTCPYFPVTSGFTDLNNLTSVASENSTQGIFPPVPTNESTEESITSSIPGSTSHYLIGQDSNKTTPAISGNQKYSAGIACSPTTDGVIQANDLRQGILK